MLAAQMQAEFFSCQSHLGCLRRYFRRDVANLESFQGVHCLCSGDLASSMKEGIALRGHGQCGVSTIG